MTCGGSNTQVPLDVLRAVVDLATEIGREGREGKPVGTMFVVGDTKRVLTMSRPLNFNPFRGYSADERDVRDRRVREAIKDFAQLEGAILIGRDGIAVAACMYLDVTAEGITLSKGLGSRHWAAAAISKKTQAIAVAVSQSSGTVRIFQDGEVVLHIEPLARPHIWQPFQIWRPGRPTATTAARGTSGLHPSDRCVPFAHPVGFGEPAGRMRTGGTHPGGRRLSSCRIAAHGPIRPIDAMSHIAAMWRRI